MNSIETDNLKIDKDTNQSSRENLNAMALAAINDIDEIKSVINDYVTPTLTVQEANITKLESVKEITDIPHDQPDTNAINELSEALSNVRETLDKLIDSDGDGIIDSLDASDTSEPTDIQSSSDSDGDGIIDSIDTNDYKTPIQQFDERLHELIKLKHISMAGILAHAIFGKGGLVDKLNDIASGMNEMSKVGGIMFDPKMNKGAGDLDEKLSGID